MSEPITHGGEFSYPMRDTCLDPFVFGRSVNRVTGRSSYSFHAEELGEEQETWIEFDLERLIELRDVINRAIETDPATVERADS